MNLTRQVALILDFHYLVPIVWKDIYNLQYSVYTKLGFVQ